MEALGESRAANSRNSAFAIFVDRWIYVVTAGLFLVAVLAGFVPDSIAKIAAVQSGQRPPFPPILHIHALVMGLWILLLLAQTTLMATGNAAWHRQLGLASAVLAPAIVIAAVILVPTLIRGNAAAISLMSPDVAASYKRAFAGSLDLILMQASGILRFAVVTGLGLSLRKRDGGAHKRLMILGTATLLGAATNRMPWLPTTMPGSPLAIFLWPSALLVPMLVWDVYRQRKLHRAYLIYIGVTLFVAMPVLALWRTPMWHGVALDLLGLHGPSMLS